MITMTGRPPAPTPVVLTAEQVAVLRRLAATSSFPLYARAALAPILASR